MHLIASIVYGLLALGLLMTAVVGCWDAIKYIDMKFSKDEAAKAQAQRRLDPQKVAKQRIIAAGLGVPVGLAVLMSMGWHLWVSFSLATYLSIAVAWFISAPVRKYLYFDTAVKLDKAGIAPRQGQRCFTEEETAFYLTQNYYRTGLRLPPNAWRDRRPFIGLFRFLNAPIFLLGWLRFARFGGPIFAEAFSALAWPVVGWAMVLADCYNLHDGLGSWHKRPWWASDS